MSKGSKVPNLPQTGGQYTRDSKGNPVPIQATKPEKTGKVAKPQAGEE